MTANLALSLLLNVAFAAFIVTRWPATRRLAFRARVALDNRAERAARKAGRRDVLDLTDEPEPEPGEAEARAAHPTAGANVIALDDLIRTYREDRRP